MRIDLTDVFTSEGAERRVEVLPEADRVSFMGKEYPICERTPVVFILSNTGAGKALMKGSGKLTVEMPCDRCLKPVRERLMLSFEEELLSPELPREEESSYLSGYELDTETFLNSEILVNMPVKVLCKPDCKGICRVCGRDLNEGECGCDTFVPDPRMAAIKDIFYANNKEV